jgi:hypothetical protein
VRREAIRFRRAGRTIFEPSGAAGALGAAQALARVPQPPVAPAAGCDLPYLATSVLCSWCWCLISSLSLSPCIILGGSSLGPKLISGMCLPLLSSLL